MKTRKNFLASLLVIVLLTSCGVLQTIQDLPKIKYKIKSAEEYKLAGVSTANKKSIKNFSAIDALKLSSGIAKGSLPLTFTLNIEAVNPNPASSELTGTDLSIESFPWKLFIDDNQLLTGNISKSVVVPSRGQSVTIPINIEFDIVKAVQDKSLDNIFNLLIRLGGADGSTSNLKLKVKPVIGTPLGKIEYPGELTIVDKTFN